MIWSSISNNIGTICITLAVVLVTYLLLRRRHHRPTISSPSSSTSAANEAAMAHALAQPMTAPSYEFKVDTVPYDDDGFVQSFTVDQPTEYEAFFRRYGVVVVRDVLTADEAKATADEAWQFIKDHFNEKVDPNDPSTWQPWPGMQQFGLVGNRRTTTAQAMRNRQNALIHSVFATLYHSPAMYVSVERFGLMRPTRGLTIPGHDGPQDRPKWKTQAEWLHIDLNPLTGEASTYSFAPTRTSGVYGRYVQVGAQIMLAGEGSQASKEDQQRMTRNEEEEEKYEAILRESLAKTNTAASSPICYPGPKHGENPHLTGNCYSVLKTQGILAAVDCRAEDGGFHAVPGFHHHAYAWAHTNRERCYRASKTPDPTSVQIAAADPIRAAVQRMPIRAGSLLIWNSLLPHGSFPNDSNRPRIVQYIKMCDARDTQMRASPLSRDDLPADFTVSPLGERLLGFKSWLHYTANSSGNQETKKSGTSTSSTSDSGNDEGFNTRQQRREAAYLASLSPDEHRRYNELHHDVKTKTGVRS